MNLRMKTLAVWSVVCVVLPALAQAQTQERLCDPEYENCRTPLLNLIANEKQAIDVAFWYMSDARYSNAIVKRFQEGLPEGWEPPAR